MFIAKQGLSLFCVGALCILNASQIAEMKEEDVLLPKFNYVYKMLQKVSVGLSKMIKSWAESPFAQVFYTNYKLVYSS